MTSSLGKESVAGEFRRQDSSFRTSIAPADAVAGRYHLYVSWACPWAHRTVIARRLLGLEDVIGVSVVDPFRDDLGWKFSGGDYVDDVNGFTYLSEAYHRTDPGFRDRVSVPVLWDKQEHRIVNNESSEILRILDDAFHELGNGSWLAPLELRGAIDELNDWLYDGVNNAVYRSGFATTQEAYEAAVRPLFDCLATLDERLGSQRFLFGEQPVETDWRAFTTLVRFDSVYYTHFKCNWRKIDEYPNLGGYLRDLYQWPGIADTVKLDEIKRHYFTTHPSINPYRILPIGPDLDLTTPPGRS